MYSHTQKNVILVLKKLLNLSFLLFKKIFYVQITITYSKEQDKLNNHVFNNTIDVFFCVHVCIHVFITNFQKNSLSLEKSTRKNTRKKNLYCFVEYYKILSKFNNS